LLLPTHFVFLILHPLSIILFPYTTLFRSLAPRARLRRPRADRRLGRRLRRAPDAAVRRVLPRARRDRLRAGLHGGEAHAHDLGRSEEHTSELQSRENLVCRLLLDKTYITL